MTDANVEALRASINQVQGEIGRIQSALAVVNDRADGALAIMGRLSEGSNNERLQQAIEAIASLPVAAEEMLAKTALAVDELEAYAATR